MDPKLREQVSKIWSILPDIEIKQTLDCDSIDYSRLKEVADQFLLDNKAEDCRITTYVNGYEERELHLIYYKEKTDDEIQKELKNYKLQQESRLRQLEDEARKIKIELEGNL